MEITPEIREKLALLEEKYSSIGQDMLSYLEGLLYSNSLTYWEYVHLDTLLSLQTPRTDFPDEEIFIAYHQITELYFKLVLSEIRQLVESHKDDPDQWKKRIKRIVNYFKNLSHSFDVMSEGMDKEQFLKFRMSLLPASGFQSVQYRMIELRSTELFNLVKEEQRENLDPADEPGTLYDSLYWKYGNIELRTGKKTLTLRMFEEKYDDQLRKLVMEVRSSNLSVLFQGAPPEIREDEELQEMLREYDLFVNVFWPLSHYKTAVKYLFRDQGVIKATGGTNWQRYLPPKFQRRIFFPYLWTQGQRDEWGKAWVTQLFKDHIETHWTKIT